MPFHKAPQVIYWFIEV